MFNISYKNLELFPGLREAPRPKMKFSERSFVVMLLSEAKREKQRIGQALSPKDFREEPCETSWPPPHPSTWAEAAR